jgi:hypothetical protein
MPVALPLLCSGRERRPRLAVMPLERLAPIPRCAECEAAWLPADEERWQAWLTDDEPPYPSSTARSALSGSAATEELGWTDLRRSRQGGPNHSRDPAPTQRSLAAAHGGPRPVAAARLGSGRNRRADPRKRIRLEAQAQALGPEQLPTSVWKLWISSIVEPQARTWALKRRVLRLYDTFGAVWDHSNGGRAENSSERARISAGLPNVCLRFAVRTAPPCV